MADVGLRIKLFFIKAGPTVTMPAIGGLKILRKVGCSKNRFYPHNQLKT